MALPEGHFDGKTTVGAGYGLHALLVWLPGRTGLATVSDRMLNSMEPPFGLAMCLLVTVVQEWNRYSPGPLYLLAPDARDIQWRLST